MKLIGYKLPISREYGGAIFDAVMIQFVLTVLVGMIMDGMELFRQVMGIALVAFWLGTAVLIWRHPQTPTRMDLRLISYGYFPVMIVAYFLASWIWHLRGVL